MQEPEVPPTLPRAPVEDEVRLKTPQEFRADVEASPDPNSLMQAVLAAERGSAFDHDKPGLFRTAQEKALNLGDREVAIMYGQRIAAEVMVKASETTMLAADAMVSSSNNITNAATSIAESANAIYRSAHQG